MLLAASASAETLEVDTTTDVAAGTDDGLCTLRDAITSANADADGTADCGAGSGPDVISFDSAVFVGQPANSTINVLGTTLGPLPAITDDLSIMGGTCGMVSKPCTGINVTQTDSDALTASGGADLAVDGLSIIGAGVAINGTAAGAFSVQHSWLGLNLMNVGGAANENNIGIYPGSNATIGGDTPIERNVIANNATSGIRITGGDNNTITGNYFSTDQAGSIITDTANGTNIEVSNGGGGADSAVGNVIGGADAGTPGVCDGLCNLIVHSGGGQGIALFVIGEGGATGPTTIAGNFIGLGPDGTSSGFGNGAEGIHTAGAGNVTIGGATAAARNYIANNLGFGVDSNSGSLTVSNNFIGLNAAGTAAIPNNTGGPGPSEFRQNANSGSVTNNRFGEGSVLMFGNNASFQGNTIGIGTGGEDLGGDSTGLTVGGDSNTIGGSGPGQGNTIGNQTIVGGSIGALDLTGNGNTVQGNLIGVDSSGAAHPNASNGIQIGQGDGDSDNNIIGGLSAGEANTISNSGGGGIVIGIGNDSDFNTFRGNVGRNNGGLFIDLGVFGLGNFDGGFPPAPNESVQAPTITNATSTQIMGTSTLPDTSIVDVYRTFTVGGDIKDFVGSTTVAGGNWSFTYPSLPDGTCVTAIQSNTSTPRSTGEPANAFTIGGGACDVTGPNTTIDDGPTGPTQDTTPSFEFSAEAGASFECSLDSTTNFSNCSSGFTTGTLGEGSHTFRVRATDEVGNTGPAASQTFTVDTIPPIVTITSGPDGLTADETPSFGFSSNEGGSTFECSVDSATIFAPCTSAFTAGALADGFHTFRVRANDLAGNTGAAPSRTFMVDTTAPETTVTRFIKKPRKRLARVFFEANDLDATFQCRLNGKAFAHCTSPKVFRKLKRGKRHKIQVRATDYLGNVESTPTLNVIRVPRTRRR